jgi:HlyD family secretion protein
MKAKKLAVIIPILIVAGVFGVAGVRFFIGTNDVAEEISAVPVVTGTPEIRTVEEILRYPGTLNSRETVTIVPKMAGRVERIAVGEGDLVRFGAQLIRLEAESASLQADQALSAWNAADAQLRAAERGVRDAELENAQADLNQAEEDFGSAERNFERSKRLYESGTIAKAAYEDADSKLGSARTMLENARRSVKMMEDGASSEELDMARANAEAAKSVYDLAKLQLDYAEVTAPAAGIIAKIFVDEGNMVGIGTALMAIIQADPIEACVQVPEKHYARFSEVGGGMRLRVSPIAYPDHPPFDGVITKVAPIIDPASRTFEVCASVANPAGLLKPGMYVNTEILIGSEADLLMVPDTAVVLRDGKRVLFKVVGDAPMVAGRIFVETGKKSGGFTAVTGDITETELIVILGNSFLEDGQTVETVDHR